MDNTDAYDEMLRYSRQLILEGFGSERQSRLKKSRILVIGAGGLGSPVLLYLAAAGAGNIGIVDFDTVTLSNLNRQIIHNTGDLGHKKTESARYKLEKLNPGANIKVYDTRLNLDNVEEIIGDYDIVVDATDNFTARYLISDCCFFMKKALVEGAAAGFEGILMTIVPDKTPCYRCLYPEPPKDNVLPSCANTGILGAVTGIIGSFQALEAIKLATGLGETLKGRLMVLDALNSQIRFINWAKRRNCPLCGNEPSIRELNQYDIKCGISGSGLEV